MQMAKVDRESLRGLLTDTVTLLCRNSLPFSKDLKVQGLIGITVDDEDFYIIQIDEEYGDSAPSACMERPVPTMARASMMGIPAKRPKMSVATRTPIKRTAQTVPRRARSTSTIISPGNALARQKVRQQLNFPSPQRGMQMPNPAVLSQTHPKQVLGMRSPQSGSMLSAPTTPVQGPPVRFMQSPRLPLAQQRPRKMMMLEDGKRKPPALPSTKRTPSKPVLKAEQGEIFGSFGKLQVKMERTHSDVICVESDEENSDVKKIPNLVPFSSGGPPASLMQETMEDDKTKALQAIMNQALNEARAVSSSLANAKQGDSYQEGATYQADSYQSDGYMGSCHMTSSEMFGNNEAVIRKTEPVTSSQLPESDMGYDTMNLGNVQYQDDFNSTSDMKPFFDQNSMSLSWDGQSSSFPMQPMSSPSWHMATSQPQTPSKLIANSMKSPPWIKTENTPISQKTLTNMARNRATPMRSPQSSGAYSSPQHLASPGIPSRPTSASSTMQQDMTSNWKSVTMTKFICNINSCEKEFTTKRAMRHHQKTLHGAFGDQAASDSASNVGAFMYEDT